MKYIALLRGINVGGHKKILMTDLIILLSVNDEFYNIKTYIQSGNIVFESKNDDTAELTLLISELIFKKYDFNVAVQVYDRNQWDSILNKNPFLGDDMIDTKRLNVTMLDKIPNVQDIATLKRTNFAPDSYILDANIIYCNYLNGVGKSKMTSTTFERKLKVSATSRNWNTMLKIKELLSI